MSEPLGLQFVRAIAENNFEAFKDLFSEDIVFTAATPGKTWHAIGRTEIEKNLRRFFTPEEKISEVFSVNHYLLPGRARISYVFRGHEKNLDCLNTSTRLIIRSTRIRLAICEFCVPGYTSPKIRCFSCYALHRMPKL